jgi:hypothetical protein
VIEMANTNEQQNETPKANIEVINAVELTPTQQRAIRSLARHSKKSGNELAKDLLAQVIRGRFKAMVESEVTKLGELYDMASANGFEQALTKAEFISQKRSESAEILAGL